MRRFLLMFAICLVTLPGLTQQNEPVLISGEFRNTSVDSFVEFIEQRAPVYFYYDTAQTNGIVINASLSNESLKNAVEKALANTGILVSIYQNKTIFLTRGAVVQTSFTNTETAKQLNDSTVKESALPGKTQLASLENKLYVIGEPSANSQGRVTVAGYVRDEKTGEPISGVSIRIEKLKIGVTSDDYGYYSISVPKGRHQFIIQSLGMNDARRNLLVHSDGKMDFEMKGQVTTLKNVVISAQKVSNVKSPQLGMQKIDIRQIRQIPVVFGEADVLRVVTTMPGVKTVGEASTGLNVRGGSTDQNLILFNDATVYNPSHFFGMFSAFNPDVIKDVTLYKGSIPARYGGRLSSVLDIASREGNKKNISGSAGIGPLTGRITLEGPLVKEKTSFILGGRSTYANWLLKLLPDEYKNSKANFYDANVVVSHEINKNNNLYLTAYLSNDRFNLNSDTVYGYRNQNISLKWKHIFNNKLNAVFIGGMDRYDYNISSEDNPVNAYRLKFSIAQQYFRTHFNYYLNASHTLDFGLNTLNYQLDPGSYTPLGESLVTPDIVPSEKALESAVYLNDKYDISASLSLEGGVRYSVYNFMGPKEINIYAEGVPKTDETRIGTKMYEKGKFIKTYGGPEFRVAVRQSLGLNSSIKAGFNTQRQYIHMLSNTAAMAPTDIWKLSDPNIRPQYGMQVSLGFYKNLKSNTIETSVEVYYKKITDYLDYKSGANLIMNDAIETDVINTKGKAYGAEVMIKKTAGKLNGWISYTWSRILLKQDDKQAGELINDGEYYPANYDKPHDVTLIGNYRINHRFSISLNTTYSTGRPITLPIGRYFYSNSYRTLFDDRNGHRIPDYFRADFSMNIDGNHKVKQKTHNSWTVGVYNLTGRKNPYSVYYVSQAGSINGYKLSIFGSAIPFVSFNIKF